MFSFLTLVSVFVSVTANEILVGPCENLYYCNMRLSGDEYCQRIKNIYLDHRNSTCKDDYLEIKFVGKELNIENKIIMVDNYAYLDKEKNLHKAQRKNSKCRTIRR